MSYRNGPLPSKVRSFDISSVNYSSDGIEDFYWPINNETTTQVMNAITRDLIPLITKNQKDFPEFQSDHHAK